MVSSSLLYIHNDNPQPGTFLEHGKGHRRDKTRIDAHIRRLNDDTMGVIRQKIVYEEAYTLKRVCLWV